jgi:hypothetical protein
MGLAITPLCVATLSQGPWSCTGSRPHGELVDSGDRFRPHRPSAAGRRFATKGALLAVMSKAGRCRWEQRHGRRSTHRTVRREPGGAGTRWKAVASDFRTTWRYGRPHGLDAAKIKRCAIARHRGGFVTPVRSGPAR